MDTPFFSIITPAYNRAKILPGTISSVLSQSFQDFEFIIIDDASDDNTEEVVESFSDRRIIYFRNKKNIERGASRNKGIELSKGKYICFLDSDDAFLPNHLQVFGDFIKNNNFLSGLLYANKKIRTDDGSETADNIQSSVFPWKDKFSHILRYTFNPSSVCISRDVFNDFRFDASIPGLEDIDLWLRIATKYEIYHINEITSIYYVHAASYSLGDERRYIKELGNFKYIFSKPEISNKLPLKERRRLLSKCHYFLAIQYFERKMKAKVLLHSVRAFFLYPSGYNNKSNRTMFAISLYSLPYTERIRHIFFRRKKRIHISP